MEGYKSRIDWLGICLNPNIVDIFNEIENKTEFEILREYPSIFIYDYHGMKKYFYDTFGEELIKKLYHPRNIMKFGIGDWNINEDLPV